MEWGFWSGYLLQDLTFGAAGNSAGRRVDTRTAIGLAAGVLPHVAACGGIHFSLWRRLRRAPLSLLNQTAAWKISLSTVSQLGGIATIQMIISVLTLVITVSFELTSIQVPNPSSIHETIVLLTIYPTYNIQG